MATTIQSISSSCGTSGTCPTLRALQSMGRLLDAQDPTVVRDTAAKLLSELFFKPLLAEMRKFDIGQALTGKGQTESTFGAQLDERIADSAASSSRALLDSLLRQIGNGACCGKSAAQTSSSRNNAS